mmetsp:Transcript_54526/g.108238  ORF Transcript_54526/g.108238 Transcript_54526/m.108238 type:complete len:207 (+) Transcript_54526:117-737(+)
MPAALSPSRATFASASWNALTFTNSSRPALNPSHALRSSSQGKAVTCPPVAAVRRSRSSSGEAASKGFGEVALCFIVGQKSKATCPPPNRGSTPPYSLRPLSGLTPTKAPGRSCGCGGNARAFQRQLRSNCCVVTAPAASSCARTLELTPSAPTRREYATVSVLPPATASRTTVRAARSIAVALVPKVNARRGDATMVLWPELSRP